MEESVDGVGRDFTDAVDADHLVHTQVADGFHIRIPHGKGLANSSANAKDAERLDDSVDVIAFGLLNAVKQRLHLFRAEALQLLHVFDMLA